MAKGQGIPIGKLSSRTGTHIETIRYFERIGLLAAPPRTPSGRRVYGEAHVRALSFIRRARQLGFTPAEVRAILSLAGSEPAPCEDVRKIASLHLTRVRAKMADLSQLEALLAAALLRCEDDGARHCAVLDMLGQPVTAKKPDDPVW